LLNALLFSLPGTPVLYYGDEIGLGDNVFLGDRNGVRTPMQWSPDKNAGFSRANPQSLYLPVILDPGYHYEANNVEVQLANPRSLLWWMRRLLTLRKRWRALGEGKCEFLRSENSKVLSYILRYQQETLLVVANLSRFTQPFELDLSPFKQMVPTELFGRTEFPEITERPYFLSLGPHAFSWFSLEPKFARAQLQTATAAPVRIPSLDVSEHWQEILEKKNQFRLMGVLTGFLKVQPWFAGKSKTIKSLTLRETISVPLAGDDEAVLAFVQVDCVEGDSNVYALPLVFAVGTEAERLRQQAPLRIIAELDFPESGKSGILYDAFSSQEFCSALLEMIWRRRRLKGSPGELTAMRTPALRQMVGSAALPKPSRARTEQNNSSVFYEDKLILKLFRRLEPGTNPELEMGRFLGARAFPHCPALAGALEYSGPGDARITLAVLHALIPSAKNAWNFTLDALSHYFDRVLDWVAQNRPAPPLPVESIEFLKPEIPTEVAECLGNFLESARLLGARTAALHVALASDPVEPGFAPEPSTPQHRRAVFQSMRNVASQNLRLLRKQLKTLPPELQPPAQRVVDLEPVIIQRYRELYQRILSVQRQRIHGVFHLGQALWTGQDFAFIDFEGESTVSLSERRIKRSPLRDVATLVRSFHYAAHAALDQHAELGGIPPDGMPRFESWLRFWNFWVSAACLKGYFREVSLSRSGILPDNEADLRVLFRVYLLASMVNEIGTELRAGPASVEVPLRGILWLLGETPPKQNVAARTLEPSEST
jgi:maltose alpha-D-glucosyltransferase/alpha-amylase